MKRRPWRGRVQGLGVDGAWLRAKGEQTGVVVAVDLGGRNRVNAVLLKTPTMYVPISGGA